MNNQQPAQKMNGAGSCSCGACQYSFTNEITFCLYCHCSICRKLTGSAFAAYGEIYKSSFRWIESISELKCFNPTPDTTRYFCGECGSFLATTHTEAPDNIYLSLGCVTSAVPNSINLEQFYLSKAPWHQSDGGRPLHTKWPDD